MGIEKSNHKKISVMLLAHTCEIEKTVAAAARICYSGSSIDSLLVNLSEESEKQLIKKLIGLRHMSPFEHASFSFGIEGVSRAMLAQLTRHRIASYSVQSQRYVNQTKNGLHYVLPESIEKLGEQAVEQYDHQMRQMQNWYEEWCEQLGEDKKEDARFVLPNAAETRLIVTMNARELLHFFEQRC